MGLQVCALNRNNMQKELQPSNFHAQLMLPVIQMHPAMRFHGIGMRSLR